MKRILKIFYFYIRPEVYALYNLDNYYFVIFLHGGGGRIVQITKNSFDKLMSDDYDFSQIINENIMSYAEETVQVNLVN